MKRLICLILIFTLFLSGCSIAGEWIKEPVTFYYIRRNYQKDMEPVMGSETREAAGHRQDLAYLLALYSMGPSAEELQATLPRNTTIFLTEHTDTLLELTLSDQAVSMPEADFTLASACIALTCMELTDVQQVTILCGDRYITIRKDHLLLDYSILQKPQEETK